MRRPVKLDSDSSPSRDVREYIDIMESIKHARLELYSIAKAGQRRRDLTLRLRDATKSRRDTRAE
jgi:hypothetical protein